MKTITTEELKTKLDRGDDFRLVMAFDGWRFQSAHIPGSLGLGSPTAAMEVLDVREEIVVYCTSRDCTASQVLYRALEEAGYERITRYEEGVLGWQEAGYTLEGDRLT
jgi:rhodanese-related sulfurtransferase